MPDLESSPLMCVCNIGTGLLFSLMHSIAVPKKSISEWVTAVTMQPPKNVKDPIYKNTGCTLYRDRLVVHVWYGMWLLLRLLTILRLHSSWRTGWFTYYVAHTQLILCVYFTEVFSVVDVSVRWIQTAHIIWFAFLIMQCVRLWNHSGISRLRRARRSH